MKKFEVTVLLIILSAFFSLKGFSQTPILKAGVAKSDITPSENLYMGGYTGRAGTSDGSYGKIFIRVLVFDDNFTRIAFIENDIVDFPDDDWDSIRKLISSETNIPFANIMLGCVHNHSAPFPGEKNKNSNWSKQLNSKLISTVKEAISNLEPVKIGGGKGASYIAMNRRKRMNDTLSFQTFDENFASQSYGRYKTDKPVGIREMEGVYRLGANPKGPIDEEVGILRIDKLSGEPKAVLINYGCHGTSLGSRNSKVSPEWNGHMLEYVEKNIPGVTGIFAPGAAGDINPRFVGGLDGYTDDLKHTAELGFEIGKEVIKVFQNISTAQPVNPNIKLVNKNITCPRTYAALMENFRNTTIDVPVTVVRIDDFTWITFPLELFHEIGKNLKASTHSPFPFIIGCCNGSLGYLPTRQSFSEGGYEPYASPFDPNAEGIFIKGVKNMLIGLY